MSRRFHPAAEAELDEAVLWYAARDPRIAARFASAVEAAQSEAEKWPQAAPPWRDSRFRLAAVHGFPYRLVYEVTDDGLWILACAHQKRKPGYWLDRAAGRPGDPS